MVNSVPFPSLLPSGSQAPVNDDPSNGYFHGNRVRFVSRLKSMTRSWIQRLLGFDEVSMARFSRIIFNDIDSRNLIHYLFTNASLIFVKFVIGVVTLNIGLVVLAMANVFDCSVLLSALASMTFSRKRSDVGFSYGYLRFEVLSGFAITCFLMFNAFFTLMEALHVATTGYLPIPSPVIIFEILGLAVNTFGMILFRPEWIGRYFGFSEYSRVSNGARRIHLHAIFTYMVCEAVFKSVLLLGAFLADIKSFFFLASVSGAALTLCLAYPIFVRSGKVLLQTRPAECANSLYKHIRDISVLEGVLECKSIQCWSLVPGEVVGTVNIRARCDANESMILENAHSVLSHSVQRLTIQVEKDAMIE